MLAYLKILTFCHSPGGKPLSRTLSCMNCGCRKLGNSRLSLFDKEVISGRSKTGLHIFIFAVRLKALVANKSVFTLFQQGFRFRPITEIFGA